MAKDDSLRSSLVVPVVGDLSLTARDPGFSPDQNKNLSPAAWPGKKDDSLKIFT